ncbi:MAG: restriction endonuclease subunit S [Pseudomonadota bacterium]
MLERPSKLVSYRFDQLADQINKRVMPDEADVERYVGLEHLDPDSLRIRRWGDTSEVESTKLLFQPGDIIFGKRRVYQRKVAVADFEGICSAHAMVLRAKPETVLPEFLPFFMQSDLFMERALSISVGSLSPTINWKALAKEEFLLPPIQEQARLVEAFSAYRAAYESLQEAEDRLADVQAAYVENLLYERFKNSPVLPVKDLLTEGPRNGKSPSAAENEEGLRSVSLSAVSNGLFDPKGCEKYISIDADEAKPFLVQAGDAFAVRGNGNRNLMGKVGLSSESYDDLIYPDLLIRLRFDGSIILKKFAVAQWNHPPVHARLAARAKSSNGIWKINGQDIKAHKLTAPSIDEQKEVVASLSHFQNRLQSIQERQRQLRQILSKLNEQAFSATVAT